MTNDQDRAVLRDLAVEYREAAERPEMGSRRDLWRRHNSLKKTRPLVLVRGGKAFQHEIPDITDLRCSDPFARDIETALRKELFLASLGDDRVVEPWFMISAVHQCRGWGVEVQRQHAGDDLTAWKAAYPLKDLDDISALRMPDHRIDEQATAERFERVTGWIGDLLPVTVNRAPAYCGFAGDLSTSLHYLRGIENFMMDMLDNADGLHRLVAFLRDGVLRTHDQAEKVGDWCGVSHNNQAMPYAEELTDPEPGVSGLQRRQLWYFAAAQEFAGVGPAMHDAFLLQYQLPILSKFGLVAYGCCEDLTRKIDLLRQIPNLRRIAVTPWADVPRCAEQIGMDYVMSWRPNPTEMVCTDFRPERIRKLTREALEASRGQHIDIMLKDIQTVQHQPERLRDWVAITREIAAGY